MRPPVKDQGRHYSARRNVPLNENKRLRGGIPPNQPENTLSCRSRARTSAEKRGIRSTPRYVEQTDVTLLAGAHEPVERSHGLLDRRRRGPGMHLVEGNIRLLDRTLRFVPTRKFWPGPRGAGSSCCASSASRRPPPHRLRLSGLNRHAAQGTRSRRTPSRHARCQFRAGTVPPVPVHPAHRDDACGMRSHWELYRELDPVEVFNSPILVYKRKTRKSLT